MDNEHNNQFQEDTITVSIKDAKDILIKDIALNTYIEIASILKNDDGTEMYVPSFEGGFGWYEGSFCAFVRHDWYRKYWDYALGLSYHMDLMRRLIEFKQS